MRKYIGIDYHKRFSYGTIMLSSGQIVKQSRFENNVRDLSDFLGPHSGQDSHAVLEAGYNSLVMYDWLDELTESVTLAHPRKVKIIAEAKVKTDKIDSELLAHLLRCDMIPAAHASSQSARRDQTASPAPAVFDKSFHDAQKPDSFPAGRLSPDS